MADINLLTIHWGCSYGGTMQTYATIKLLNSLGHKVTLINLIHPKHKFKIGTHKGLSWILTELLFSLFQRMHFGNMTKRMYSINQKYIPKSDFTIVGSDQVWNEDITYPINMSYFLDFVNNSHRIAYSSSFGKFQWENDSHSTAIVKSCLSRFKAISVREETGVSICKNIFGLDSVHVLDPTLVYDNYDSLLRGVKPSNVLYPFLLITTAQTDEICKIISKETGLPIYRANKIKRALSSGPLSWLRRIKNSEYIITDSFHGLAFSILFHKRFIVLCADKKKFTRLESLLSLLDLKDRYVTSVDDLQLRVEIITKAIDYRSVDLILENERKRSISFLMENLNLDSTR